MKLFLKSTPNSMVKFLSRFLDIGYFAISTVSGLCRQLRYPRAASSPNSCFCVCSLSLMNLLLWMFWKINSKEKWWTCSMGAYSFRHQKLWQTKVVSFHAQSDQIINRYPHSFIEDRFSHPGESSVGSFSFPSGSNSSSKTNIIVITSVVPLPLPSTHLVHITV